MGCAGRGLLPFETPMGYDAAFVRETCQQLAEEIGADGVAELLESFLADTPNRLDELERFVAASDQPSLKRAAHSVKGSSSIFGLNAIESAANRLEHSFATGEIAHQAQLLVLVREEFRLCQDGLRSLAAELAAQA